MAAGKPGTEFPNVFNTVNSGTLMSGDPATTVDAGTSFSYNGAVGLTPDVDCMSDPLCAPKIRGDGLDGHVDPRQIMDIGVMNGNIPAPLMAIDEDDEFFLTLTNVGMIMRPDLFEQHIVHFHGYPNASAFYDGVPDASVAINIGGSFTYYFLAPDAAHISGIATSPRPNTCRWAWWVRSMCARARIASLQEPTFTLPFNTSKAICARSVTTAIFCAAIRCPRFTPVQLRHEPL